MLISNRRLMILEGAIGWQLLFFARAINDLRYCSEIYRLFPGALCIVEIGKFEVFQITGNPLVISVLFATIETGLLLIFSWAGYKSLNWLQTLVDSRGKKNGSRQSRVAPATSVSPTTD